MSAQRTICAACRARLPPQLAWPLAASRPTSQRQFSSTPTTSATSSPTSARRPSRRDPRPPRKPRAPLERDEAADLRALNLFESTINSARQTDNDGDSHRTDFDGLLRLAKRIDETLRHESSGQITPEHAAKECYSIVTEEILAAVDSADGGRLPGIVEAPTARAMRKVLDVKFSPGSQGLPSAAALCKVLAALGLKRPNQLDPFIALLESLVPKSASAVDSASETVPLDPRLLDDLLECWRNLAPLVRDTDSATAVPDTFLAGLGAAASPAQREPARALRKIFPSLASHLTANLVVAVVGTHAVLSDPRSEAGVRIPDLEAQRATLSRIVEKLDLARAKQYFSGREQLWQHVVPLLRAGMADPPSEEFRPKGVKGAKLRQKKSGEVSYTTWHQKFSILFKFNDAAGLDSAWIELTEPTDDPNRADKLHHHPELFDYIIFQCCSKASLRQDSFRELTERVLRYMNQISLKPTVRTFTAMMEGWKLARRLDRINDLWKHVIKSGTPLDQHIWSSRIAALGWLGQPNDGVKALEEMNRHWERDSENELTAHRAVKPGIVSVNAAISGLLKSDRLDAARTVLVWAGGKNIQPDGYTYNTLLTYMLRKGMSDEAEKILSAMSAQGIQPDGATFTIILDEAMAELPNQTPPQQRATIARVFSEMAACGINPNQETYGKMLHILTRDVRGGRGASPQPAPTTEDEDRVGQAVEVVLEHLHGAGIRLSPHLCTMLFEFYFARRTPRDEQAIRTLLSESRSRSRILTDRTFWETVMRHFNGAGDTAAALEIFYDLNDWGSRAGLPVLEPMLRSLIDQRRWDEAQKLVATVQAQTRPTAEPGDRYWRHAFWAIARENGLMQPEQDTVGRAVGL